VQEAAQETASMRGEMLPWKSSGRMDGSLRREREDLGMIEYMPMVGEPLTMTDVV